jgi:hypothetical protein
VGTDIGVLASNDEGASWEVLGVNLPSVVVNDLYIHEASEMMFAGTYGRSSYKIDLSGNILSLNDNSIISEVIIYPNPASEYVQVTIPELIANVSVIIHDALGRKVMQQEITNTNSVRMDLNGISRGIYYVSISEGKNSVTKKLIIK